MTEISPSVWMNKENYRECWGRNYRAWLCKPPFGTVIINRFENPGLVKDFNGKEFFTVSELAELGEKDPFMFRVLLRAVEENHAFVTEHDHPFVIAGVLGELYCAERNSGVYALHPDSYIENTDFEVKWRGSWIDFDRECAGEMLDEEFIGWLPLRASKFHRLITYPDTAVCLQISTNDTVKGTVSGVQINQPGLSHGKGDFIVARYLRTVQGTLSRNFIIDYVLNGELFPKVFKIEGWENEVSNELPDVTEKDLPNLITKEDVGYLSTDFAIRKHCIMERFWNLTEDRNIADAIATFVHEDDELDSLDNLLAIHDYINFDSCRELNKADMFPRLEPQRLSDYSERRTPKGIMLIYGLYSDSYEYALFTVDIEGIVELYDLADVDCAFDTEVSDGEELVEWLLETVPVFLNREYPTLTGLFASGNWEE